MHIQCWEYLLMHFPFNHKNFLGYQLKERYMYIVIKNREMEWQVLLVHLGSRPNATEFSFNCKSIPPKAKNVGDEATVAWKARATCMGGAQVMVPRATSPKSISCKESLYIFIPPVMYNWPVRVNKAQPLKGSEWKYHNKTKRGCSDSYSFA